MPENQSIEPLKPMNNNPSGKSRLIHTNAMIADVSPSQRCSGNPQRRLGGVFSVIKNLRGMCVVVALAAGVHTAMADETALFKAIQTSSDWTAAALPGTWKTVSADPMIYSQKETTPVFGYTPKRIIVFCRNSNVYEAEIVYMQTGYNIWNKKMTAADKQAYADSLKQMETDLPAALTRITGKPGTPVTLTANALNFSFNATDFSFAGLTLRLYIEEGKTVALFISKPEDAPTNLLQITSPDDRRAALAKNVVRKPNGDVVIAHLPVIDQDGRPDCGPACWTEVARYYGLNVFQEMMLSDRRDGGKGIDGAAALKKDWETKFDFAKVQTSIDSGNPIWFDEHGHVALITGYNAAANEVFRTDSWGEGSRNKAVPVDKFIPKALGFIYFVP